MQQKCVQEKSWSTTSQPQKSLYDKKYTLTLPLSVLTLSKKNQPYVLG